MSFSAVRSAGDWHEVRSSKYSSSPPPLPHQPTLQCLRWNWPDRPLLLPILPPKRPKLSRQSPNQSEHFGAASAFSSPSVAYENIRRSVDVCSKMLHIFQKEYTSESRIINLILKLSDVNF